jgi:hypothetical protein
MYYFTHDIDMCRTSYERFHLKEFNHEQGYFFKILKNGQKVRESEVFSDYYDSK